MKLPRSQQRSSIQSRAMQIEALMGWRRPKISVIPQLSVWNQTPNSLYHAARRHATDVLLNLQCARAAKLTARKTQYQVEQSETSYSAYAHHLVWKTDLNRMIDIEMVQQVLFWELLFFFKTMTPTAAVVLLILILTPNQHIWCCQTDFSGFHPNYSFGFMCCQLWTQIFSQKYTQAFVLKCLDLPFCLDQHHSLMFHFLAFFPVCLKSMCNLFFKKCIGNKNRWEMMYDQIELFKLVTYNSDALTYRAILHFLQIPLRIS